MTQQKWKQKELDFQLDLPEAEYCGNASLLKEVWTNLLDNAAKFSEQGNPVQVTLLNQEEALTISVTDHGEDMDKTVKAHIFEQFCQGDTSHKTQGNGLGMAMVYKIVKLHKGEIQIDSSPGNGSCITVILPKN